MEGDRRLGQRVSEGPAHPEPLTGPAWTLRCYPEPQGWSLQCVEQKSDTIRFVLFQGHSSCCFMK